MSELRKRKGDSTPFVYSGTSALQNNILVRRVGPFGSWLRVIACCALAISIATHLHYRVPQPQFHRGIDPTTGVPEFSEYNAMEIISYLSDTIGYRIVGNVEEAQTAEYLENTILSYKRDAKGIPGAPKFDIWVQHESGSHRFDIVDKMVLKSYTNITNIIARLSCPVSATDSGDGRPCEENAVLLNSHFDTTLGSPGATDDGSGTAVMLEIIRVLSQRDWSDYKNAIVFLFNGAEETLQDASHAFITMHELKDTIRTVVNIDACGTIGREILFQANSREMVDAYKQAPYPHGTVLANDVFRTGLIMSDTDFRQFVQYGNLTGIDMAIYKNSYLYHTHLDVQKNMEPGAMQHLGANTLAIVDYLAKNTTLTGIKPSSDTVFFDVHGLFFVVYSWSTALILQMGTVGLGALYFIHIVRKDQQSSPYRPLHTILWSYLVSIVSIVLSAMAACVLPIAVALVLTSTPVNRHMAWFAREWYGALLFCPAGWIGSYGIQYMSYWLRSSNDIDVEHTTFISLMVTFALLTIAATLTGLASSYLLWLYCLTLLVACGVNEFAYQQPIRRSLPAVPRVRMWSYALSVFPLALLDMDYTYALIDIFVPLTGRMGVAAPVDSIVAVIFGLVSFMICVPSVAHVHRFGKHMVARILVFLIMVQAAVIATVILCGGTYGGWAFPYDELHPKRIFVQHLKNLSSGEAFITLAEADYGPYTKIVLDSLEQELGVPVEVRTASEGFNDWDSIYPFGAYFGGFRFNAEPFIRKHTLDPKVADTIRILDGFDGPFPELTVHNDRYDPATGIRSFSVSSFSPSYTWTVISFDGEVMDWSIVGEEPLVGTSHYVVRNVAGYGSEGWKLDLAVKVPDEQRPAAAKGRWKMRFQFTALEKGTFATRGEERLVGGVGMLDVVQRVLPVWMTPTWLGTVVKVWEL